MYIVYYLILFKDINDYLTMSVLCNMPHVFCVFCGCMLIIDIRLILYYIYFFVVVVVFVVVVYSYCYLLCSP
jgi:hypothetical protein